MTSEWPSDQMTKWPNDWVTGWQEASQTIDRMVYLDIWFQSLFIFNCVNVFTTWSTLSGWFWRQKPKSLRKWRSEISTEIRSIKLKIPPHRLGSRLPTVRATSRETAGSDLSSVAGLGGKTITGAVPLQRAAAGQWLATRAFVAWFHLFLSVGVW